MFFRFSKLQVDSKTTKLKIKLPQQNKDSGIQVGKKAGKPVVYILLRLNSFKKIFIFIKKVIYSCIDYNRDITFYKFKVYK